MCDPGITTVVTSFIEKMDDFVRARGITIPPSADLVFDIIRNDENHKIYCAYYFADHSTKTIFWLDSYPAEHFTVWEGVKGVTSPSHVGQLHALSTPYMT